MKPLVVAIAILAVMAAEACSSTRRSHAQPAGLQVQADVNQATPSPPPPPPPPTDATAPRMGDPTPPVNATAPRVADPAPPPVNTTAPRMGDPAPPPVKPDKPSTVPTARPKLTLKQGMQKVADSDLEGSLERWAEGTEIDLKHVIKRTGVFVTVAQDVQWEDAPKRSTNPADYDRLVTESLNLAKELVAAATAGKTDEIKPLSDKLAGRCTDCHLKYK